MILKSIFYKMSADIYIRVYTFILSIYYNFFGTYVTEISTLENGKTYSIYYCYLLVKILKTIHFPVELILQNKKKYFVMISHNNKIIKNMFTNMTLCDIVTYIGKYIPPKKISNVIVLDILMYTGENYMSIKNILGEYGGNNNIKDVLNYEKIKYDNDSYIEIEYIKFPKKGKYKIDLISSHNKNICDIYNI